MDAAFVDLDDASLVLAASWDDFYDILTLGDARGPRLSLQTRAFVGAAGVPVDVTFAGSEGLPVFDGCQLTSPLWLQVTSETEAVVLRNGETRRLLVADRQFEVTNLSSNAFVGDGAGCLEAFTASFRSWIGVALDWGAPR